MWGGSEGEDGFVSLIDLFKSSSGTRISPPLLLDNAYDELDHTSRGTASFFKLSLDVSYRFVNFSHNYIFLLINIDCLDSTINIVCVGKSVSTYVAVLGTNYEVTSGAESIVFSTVYCPNSAVLGSAPSIGHRRGWLGLVDLKVLAHDNLRS